MNVLKAIELSTLKAFIINFMLDTFTLKEKKRQCVGPYPLVAYSGHLGALKNGCQAHPYGFSFHFALVHWLVTKSCPTLSDPMDCSPPGSYIHGISQARILEWVAISFSRGSPWLGLNPRLLHCRFSTTEPSGISKSCSGDPNLQQGSEPQNNL